MNIPLGIPNCPPGLEYLTTIDQLLVKQKVELLEAFIGFEGKNKYTIKNSLGQKVRCLSQTNLESQKIKLNRFPFERFIMRLKILIAARVTCAVRFVVLTWKFWTIFKMKWFTCIVRLLVLRAFSRVVYKAWKCRHHQEISLVKWNRNGQFAIQVLRWKIKMTKQFCESKDRCVHSPSVAMSNSRFELLFSSESIRNNSKLCCSFNRLSQWTAMKSEKSQSNGPVCYVKCSPTLTSSESIFRWIWMSAWKLSCLVHVF